MPVDTLTYALDNPIWNSLITHRSNFALGGDLARRFLPEIGPLAGMIDQSPEAYAELGTLFTPDQIAILFLESAPQLPAGWRMRRHIEGIQMVCAEASEQLTSSFAIEPLGEADVPEMLELTALTEPGPFAARTIELGDFIGIREDGRLAAMAGERLAMPGYMEVSAVCTHPDFRGRGYARALVSAVKQKIRARGETPILHTFAANSGAIRVYEALGFVLRRSFDVAAISPPLQA